MHFSRLTFSKFICEVKTAPCSVRASPIVPRSDPPKPRASPMVTPRLPLRRLVAIAVRPKDVDADRDLAGGQAQIEIGGQQPVEVERSAAPFAVRSR